jgi:DNA-directed RNA polymerase specialized sigma24 family protein
MNPTEEFQRLMERVGANDEAAIADLVQRFEPEIRIMVRSWLRPWELNLRKVFDSADICQSVLAWFFLKDATKRYDLSSPDDLFKMFRVMVRNRVFYHVRKCKNDKRSSQVMDELASSDVSPDQIVAAKELREAIVSRLNAEEADLVQRRLNGATWEDICAVVGGTPDARRMQLARATKRLATQMSLTT